MAPTLIDINLLKENPDNPRTISDAKFAQLIESVKNFPQMLEVRPIAFKSGFVVLGGNMRLRACKEAGLKQVPAIDCSGMTEAQQREFILKDNIGASPVPGFQLKYVYFLNESAKKRLTVPILPFSKIDEMGAGMYKGIKKTSDSSITANAAGFQLAEEGQHHPFAQNTLPL